MVPLAPKDVNVIDITRRKRSSQVVKKSAKKNHFWHVERITDVLGNRKIQQIVSDLYV